MNGGSPVPPRLLTARAGSAASPSQRQHASAGVQLTWGHVQCQPQSPALPCRGGSGEVAWPAPWQQKAHPSALQSEAADRVKTRDPTAVER